jgi:hypothetical protein
MAARRRDFAPGEYVGHWYLVEYKPEKRRWFCQCVSCGHFQHVYMQQDRFIDRCDKCRRSASGTRAKYLRP